MRSTTNADLAITSLKLNEQLLETFVRLVMAGNYFSAACKAVGISQGTFRRWMELGRASLDDKDIYRQFFLRVQEAEAYAEVYAVKSWRTHFSRDYRASRDFLARRYPERWGMQQKITLAVDNELQLILKVLETRLPPEIYGQVIVALADAQDQVREDAELEEEGLGDPFISFEMGAEAGE
jgi:hypothetical protein